MDTLWYIPVILVVVGLVVVVVRAGQPGDDAARWQARCESYEERKKREGSDRAGAAVLSKIDRFFPYVSQAAKELIKAGTEPRKALQEALRAVPGVRLGITDSNFDVVAADEWRTRHIVIWGRSGGGKTCTMTHLIRRDLEENRAAIVVCPERELFQDLLGLASGRAEDVIYFAPGDPDCPVSFNPMMSEPGDDEDRHADELYATIKRCLGEESIGPRSDPILANLVALVAGRPGETIASLRRALTDASYRGRLVAEARNEYVQRYFRDVYEKFGAGVTLPLLSRLDAFLRTASCQRALGNPTGSFTIRQVLEERKVLLADLSGLAPDSMQLIGGLLTCKLLLEVLRRETALTAEKRAVRVYIDEFPAVCGFSDAAWEALLSRSRKYHAALCLTGQFPSGVPPRIRQQLAGNAATLISFSLGAREAAAVRHELLVPGADDSLRPIPAEALVSLPVGEGYARLGSGACAVKVRFAPPIKKPDPQAGERTRKISWRIYAAPPMAVEPATVVETTAVYRVEPDLEKVPGDGRGPGRGGNKHVLLQQLVRQWGEERGFRATIEQQILGGAGRVDVALERGDLRIAVEVCVTSTAQQVAESVNKSLAAGYRKAVVLAADPSGIEPMRQRIAQDVAAADAGNVHLLTAEGVLSFLDALPGGSKPQDSTIGYRIKVAPDPATSSGQDGRRRSLARLIGRALLRQKSAS